MNRGAIANVRRQTPLLLLRTNPADALDRERGAAAFLGDLAVLLHDVAAGGLIALEPAEQLARHPAVGAHGIVFIDDIEEGEFALRVGSGFFRHGRLVLDCRAQVKAKCEVKANIDRFGGQISLRSCRVGKAVHGNGISAREDDSVPTINWRTPGGWARRFAPLPTLQFFGKIASDDD